VARDTSKNFDEVIAGTFETRGICPAYSWKWVITQCFSCKEFSAHEEWYHEPIVESGGVQREEAVLADA
jgi:hypothetical protein